MSSTDNWSKSTKPIYSNGFSKKDSFVEIKCIQFVILTSKSERRYRKLVQLGRDNKENFFNVVCTVKMRAIIQCKELAYFPQMQFGEKYFVFDKNGTTMGNDH